MSDAHPVCVIVPVKDDANGLVSCLNSLVLGLPPDAQIVVVDDGSTEPVAEINTVATLAKDPRITILRHAINRGPSATRNTGIAFARERGAVLAILLDADCVAGVSLVEDHQEVHRLHPEIICCGGAVCGYGRGLWARLDGLMSWFTSLPEIPEHPVRPPYHIPTTNMSIKIDRFPADRDLFDVRLQTGEDVEFVMRLWRENWPILFSPRPRVCHRDRDTLGGFLRHQYRWGLHTYLVRRGFDRLGIADRLAFSCLFFIGSPFYVLFATGLNMAPLLRQSPRTLLYLPAILLVYAIKAIAVLHGTLYPVAASRG